MSQAGSSSQPRGKGKATKRTSGELTPVTTDETNKRSKAEGKKRALNTMREEQAYENGVIRKIVVENFMNHGHMQIDLDPHVNFIVGKNGSGKSAIVASCIAGLACKASATGRNLSSYKHFIKHGCDYALIQIHLANGGHGANGATAPPTVPSASAGSRSMRAPFAGPQTPTSTRSLETPSLWSTGLRRPAAAPTASSPPTAASTGRWRSER